jgi:hypothetical protein
MPRLAGLESILEAATWQSMADSIDPRAHRSRRPGRSAVLRVLGNASLLAFASFLVISLAEGHLAAGLLWAGALLVFFAPALDRQDPAGSNGSNGMRRADALRWCGLALAAAGAAVLLS